MEWWSVELLIIFAGLLPHPSLSVSVTGICLNVMSLVYMLSFGLSGPTSISFNSIKARLEVRDIGSNPGCSAALRRITAGASVRWHVGFRVGTASCQMDRPASSHRTRLAPHTPCQAAAPCLQPPRRHRRATRWAAAGCERRAPHRPQSVTAAQKHHLSPAGPAGASSTRVSKALGGGRPRAARRTARMSCVLSLSATSLCAVLILVFRNQARHPRNIVLLCGSAAVRRADRLGN